MRLSGQVVHTVGALDLVEGERFVVMPVEHQAFWQTVRAQARVADWGAAVPAGAWGERFGLQGVKEADVFVGDMLRFAACDWVVVGPRALDDSFATGLGFAQALQLARQSGWCGFVVEVRRAGHVAVGDAFEVVCGDRHVSVRELFVAALSQ